jgi:hypothetical protein
MAKRELEPLIPMDEFKKLVAAIAQVPKETVERAKRMKSRTKPSASSKG